MTQLKSSGIIEETVVTWEEFKDKFIRETKDKIHLTKQMRNPWWINTCDKVIGNRKIAYINWNSDKTGTNLASYIEMRNQMGRNIRRVERE